VELGDSDGFGYYGLLEETGEGLLCHECGRAYEHLGLHVWRGHGMTAAQYREAHGLQRGRGLVAKELRSRIQTAAAARMTTPAGEAFKAARDPQAAQAVRLREPRPWRAAQRDSHRKGRTGTGRLGTEVVCGECGAVFCPLRSARRRRFCTRSCASRYNRRIASQTSP